MGPAGDVAATTPPVRRRAPAAALRLAEARDARPPSAGPQSVSVVLTNACNLNCVTCWTYSPLRRERPAIEWVRRRLDRPLLNGLFADLAGLGTERVIFTGGGDPLAHPEFLGIAGDAKAAGLKVTLISNLTLVREREAFLALRLDTLLANFSCADAATYVAFHPNRAAADFGRLLDTLRAVRAGGTELKLVFVVCRVNAHVVADRLIDVAAELGASIQLKPMSATPDTGSLLLTGAQRDVLLEARPRLERRAAEAGVHTNADAFFAALSGESAERFPIDSVGCRAGHYYARVDARGDVRYCCNPAEGLTVGSLHDAAFADLWHSAAWQALRERLHGGGFFEGCERCGKFDLNLRIAEQLRVPR